ncbi:S9 family peptidase [Aureimonas fodinaquatilis]|uniref:S9 family peptidase n=1 Tax=Aureimonas fodinaquatilis TaxID=2565783 RepID=A0A5B0E0R6_9HYPH|nr:S9 family peptidase [Aureimonas fodinaquatilis]KAA0972667.1 S9 family peptidase [Aureimonas fodinaquatilis]
MSPSELISVETLFGAPHFSRAQIAPDGSSIAYLSPWRGRLNIFLRAVDGAQSGGDLRVTADEHRNIEGFCWAPDSKAILYVQDTGGDENWHLHRVSLDEELLQPVDLTPFPDVRVMDFNFSTQDPKVIYLQMNARDATLVDLHRLNIDTGELETIAENPGRYVHWLVIPGASPHALIVNSDNDYELSRYENGQFVSIATFDGDDNPLGPLPCVPTPDGKGLWVGSNRGTDRMRLARIDLASGAESEIDSHPVFDLDTPRPEADPRFPPSLVLNPVTGELLGARYLGEYQVIHPLSPDFAAVLAKLSTLSDAEPGQISCDKNGRYWVVEFTRDCDPGTTWLYDNVTGRAQIIGRRQPDLDEAMLASVRPVTITSRDGLKLPCHVTLPKDVRHRKLPTVLLVHGGPWYRDCACYDPEVQLLANRGYGVLQVNFRGSTGYGKGFMQAGKGEFAGRMHDDLMDAVDWAIAEGITDPKRVAIYGCSYGGYAALVGASFTPERFAAAISYSGMSDLRALVEGALPFIRKTLANTYLAYMGDPDIPEENARMLAKSPVSRLDRIKCPLMVVHGAQDVRVALSHAELVVKTLKARGNDVEFLLNEKEGHWFINQDSNYELYRAIEDFLARHLGAQASVDAATAGRKIPHQA